MRPSKRAPARPAAGPSGRQLRRLALVWLLAASAAVSASSVCASSTSRPARRSIFDSLLGAKPQEPSEQGVQAAGGQQLSPADVSSLQNQHERLSDKVTLPGDILLGGLFPIHMKGAQIECGQINRDRGIQRLEAMLYALDKINADSQLLPDIKLGAILLDSCSSSTYALNQSLEFIRASINTVESSAFECKDKSSPRPKYGSKMIAGVIGGSYSEVSLQVANLLRLFRIPQVSYASTGTALSDKSLYDLFARTVPSDMFQARAIADIVRAFGWSYVSLVSSEGLYGDSGSKEFIKQASERRVCIATHEKIPPKGSEEVYDAMVANLLKHNATGVVLFTRAEDTREVLLAAKRMELDHKFAWVAADGWGTHQKLVENVEQIAWGAITVELQAKAIPDFDEYMKALTPWSNARNPWFNEYWQEWFGCQLQADLLQQQRIASGLAAAAAAASGARRRQTQGGSQPARGYADDSAEPGQPDQSDYDGQAGEAAARARRSARPGCSAAADTQQALNGTECGQAQLRAARVAGANAPKTRATRSTSAAAAADNQLKQFCSPNLRINESNGYRQEQKVQFVVDAVYAMAHALHKAWQNLCDAQPGVVCEALKELNGGEFYTNYLLNVSFKDLAGSEVKFDERGDGLGRYIIYNFRRVRSQNGLLLNNSLSALATVGNASESIGEQDLLSGGSQDTVPIDKLDGQAQDKATLDGQQSVVEHIYASNVDFEYSAVGRWTEDKFNLVKNEIEFFQGERQVPESYCSKPCELGQAKIMRAGDHCCWICKTCQPYEFLPDEFSCQDCGIGRWPVPDKTSCYDLPQKFIRWDSLYSLISLSIACLGIALTIFVSVIFIKFLDTPVVKASGRELSFILLAGVAFCHLCTFVLLTKPTAFICGCQRFLVNFGFALMYASLLVKTNRISRIFNCARKSAKRPSFISPKSQMLITGILVAIQIFLTIVWFVFEPPGVRADSPEGRRDEVILKCRIKGKSFILSLVYNMILITTCTIYAVKTRKIPENFNESKFIGFTMYTTIVIWLAFVTMFFGTDNSYEIQINTMCVCISLSAYVTLFCLFSPKVSIILLHPDKNVRKLTMNSATYKRAFKPVSSVASADWRINNLPSGSAQVDAASAGPVSTTSNALNLGAESNVLRQQDSSIASNIVNSNSAGSNSSQKTRTNVSQQLALVGVCSNCGSHQLTSMPNVSSSSKVTIAGGKRELLSSSKALQCSKNNYTNEQVNSGTITKCRVTSSLPPSKSSMVVSSQGATTSGGGCIKLYQKGSAKVLHSSKAPQAASSSTRNAGNDRSLACDAGEQNYGHQHQKQQTALQQHQQQHKIQNQLAENDQQPCQAMPPSCNNRRQIASLNRLHELNSMTSAERHGLDESLSSLANDSLMMIASKENCDDAVSGYDNNICHLLSDKEHGPYRGSDSMLCNQSIQSLDYCSDCCPSSSCHCSCPMCSSNGGEDNNSSEVCVHPFSGADLTRSNEDNGSGDYDAMCILQLIHNDDCALKKSKATHGVHEPSTSSTHSAHSMCIIRRKKSDETPQLPGEASTSLTQRAAAATSTGHNFNSSSHSSRRTGGDGGELRGQRPQTIEMRTIAESDHQHHNVVRSESDEAASISASASVADCVLNQAAATVKIASGYTIQGRNNLKSK